jgi:hypothetical protein
MVTITNGTETKEMKYKKAESLIESGEWRVVDGQATEQRRELKG